MRIKIRLILIFILSGLKSYSALDAPSLRCIDVKPNGDVEIFWVAPSDPTSVFDSYQIFYSSTAGGTFNLVATIPVYNQNSWIHLGANAQNVPGYYYMKTVSDAPAYQYSVSSDTLQTMLLNASNPLNGTAPLSWNSMHNPPLATWSNYNILYEYPAGNWNQAGTASAESFTDTIGVCNNHINYKITRNDISGCTSVSSIDGDIYQNIIPPRIPMLDSVSLNPITQKAVLGWQSSGSGDTKGYIIYRFTGVWAPIDTVWGINTTTYENPNSAAATNSESYCIAALDSCSNTSPLTNGHSSIFLNSMVNACERKIELNWSSYIGFQGIAKYIIYVSKNNGNWTILDSVLNSTLSYDVYNLDDDSNYCFFVKAISTNGYSSSSNRTCKTANFPNLPAYVYIRYASVNTDGSVDIKWVNDNSVNVNGFSLQSSLYDSGPWQSIDYRPFTATHEYFFNDITANANKHSTYYRVAVFDSCNNEAMYSNVVNTIFLSGKPLGDLTNELIWNEYDGWATGVNEYSLFRSIDNVPDIAPIITFTSGTQTYIDDVASFNLSHGLFSYRLIATEETGNPFGYIDTVFSNQLEIQQIPRLFIANAFSPTGYNKTFCPIGVYVDHTSYSFIIFNEFGKEMFNTTDFYECWNGTINGKPAPVGVYHYILQMTLPQDQHFTKRGHITLIR